jgi:hypothetical protein
MGFLRRVFGGRSAPGDSDAVGSDDPAAADEDELARELELARFDQDRVDDLVRRQQRYADRKWTPPSQGGERRADDGDATPG